jgi:hypothetical protein
MFDINRRQFPRIDLEPPAIAYDETGRVLGNIVQTSGGGMMIAIEAGLEEELNVGQTIHVVVVEPQSQTKNTIDAMIRYNDGENVGLEFVTKGTAAAANPFVEKK